jgi:hypothetical protein
MVDTLVRTIERIDTTAQYRVEQELLADFRRVTGKTGLLFRIAEGSVERPDGIVWDVVSPAVGGERVIHELVSEYKATGPGLSPQVPPGDASFVSGSLPASIAAAARHTRVPLEQRRAPADHPGPSSC